MRVKIIVSAMLVSALLSSCNLNNPQVENPSALETAAGTESVSPSVPEAQNLISFNEMGIAVGFDYPDGIQQGADASVQPVYTNVGPTELPYPQHARILLTAYSNGSQDHNASGIRIYRTAEVDALEAGIVEEFAAVMAGQVDHHIDFPRINGAGFLVDAQLTQVALQNGNGFRFLYTSGFAAFPLRSTALSLMYQGMTSDEKYFVSVQIPVDAPFLGEFLNQPQPTTNEEFMAHYQAVNDRLNAAAPDEFNPSLNAIDQLISSIVVIEK